MTQKTFTKRRSSTSQAMATVTRRCLALLAGLLGLAIIWSGGQLVIAGMAHYQASVFIDHWEKQSSKPSEQAWHIAEDAINRAINVYPVSNGKYLEKLGYIHQWRASDFRVTPATAQVSRHAAAQAFRDAIQARPTWPRVWVGLAYAKLTLLEFDDEFTQALQQAHDFGPWRIEINRRIATIGLIALSDLNTQQVEIIQTAVQRTAQYSSQERQKLFKLAAITHTLEQLCNMLQADDSMCKRPSKT